MSIKTNDNNKVQTEVSLINEDEKTAKLKEKLDYKEKKRLTIAEKNHEKRAHKLAEKNRRRDQNNKYKIEKIKSRENYNKDKERICSKSRHFSWYNFFTKWFFIGLILLLISICISMVETYFVDDKSVGSIILSVLAGLFSSVGIALLVGCVFDFSKNSEAFMGFISNLLSEIIVSKTFLSSLAAEDKKEALKLIIQPTNKQIEQSSNIDEYFKKKIDDYMNMFDKNFKTNVILNVEARKNDQGIVFCESTITYRIYKIKEEFEPIKIIFEKEGSESLEFKIIHENGETKVGPKKERKRNDKDGALIQTVWIYPIPDDLKFNDHLTIKRKVREPGSAHWINFCWESMTPYEGITCHIKCFDGLKIKDFMLFDNKAYYHTEKSRDGQSMEIISSQWLEADTGFYVMISDDFNVNFGGQSINTAQIESDNNE